MIKEVNVKMFECSKCGDKFVNEEDAVEHEANCGDVCYICDNPDVIYMCPECSSVFCADCGDEDDYPCPACSPVLELIEDNALDEDDEDEDEDE